VPGDPGHLTYGQSQTTLASGNLHHLIKAYCDHPDSALSNELQPYLSRVACRDVSLDHDSKFRQLLKQGGDDPVMRAVQHTFFRKSFWEPAAAAARKANITTGLGTAVVYDSFIHGSWKNMRDRVCATCPLPVADVPAEQKWIRDYVETRRQWLATHRTIPLLRRTVYRMDTFRKLIADNNWELKLPLLIRGIRIEGLCPTESVLADDLRRRVA
jgi:chitosanase